MARPRSDEPDKPLPPGLDETPLGDFTPRIQFLSLRAILAAADSALGPSLRESPWDAEEARAFIGMLVSNLSERQTERYLVRPSERQDDGRASVPLFLGILASAGPHHIRVEGGEAFSHIALLAIAAVRRAREGDQGRDGPSAQTVTNPAVQQLLREGALDLAGEWSAAERRYSERLGQIDIWLNGEVEPEYDDEVDYRSKGGLLPAAANTFSRFLLDEVRFLHIHAPDEATGEALHQGLVRAGKRLGAGFVKAAMAAEITGLAGAESASMAFDHEIAGLHGLGSNHDLRALRSVLAARYAQDSGGAPPAGPVASEGAFHRDPVAAPVRRRPAFPRASRLFGPGLLLHLQWAQRFAVARRRYRPGLEALYFLDRAPIDLDDRLLIASIAPSHTGAGNWTRIRIALAFMDSLAARLLWNGLRPDNSLRRRLADLCADASEAEPREFALRLAAELAGISPGFTARGDAALGLLRPSHLHGIVARLTACAQFQLDGQDHYPALEVRRGQKAFEIMNLSELLASEDEKSVPGQKIPLARLALAPKDFARMWNEAPIGNRPELLESLGPLAASMALRRSSAISAANARLNPPLPAFRRFDETEIDARNAALAALAMRIWDPARLIAIAEGRL